MGRRTIFMFIFGETYHEHFQVLSRKQVLEALCHV